MAIDIKSINFASLVISVIAIVLIVCVKFLINEKYKKQLHNIPIPVELLVVISNFFFSFLANITDYFFFQIDHSN